MADLSILIPARNEQFLARTIQDLLENIEGDTEILVGLDGKWAEPPIPDHDRVKILYYPEAIGQRALTNQLCKLSKAKYVMKVDAHCAFDKGFDVKLMADMQDDWTVAPLMRNLHAFDWVCPDGHRRYQSPSGPCKDCGKDTVKDVVWIAKTNPRSTSYRFDKTLHFQYFNEYKKHQQGDLVESMSLQGSCFMMTREKYWELNICDETFGSWGQQGTEVACKTWLSGGKVMINKKTWYAHMFRTQGGDFSFPYPQSGRQIEKAREYSRELFVEGKWKGKYPLSWLVNKFAPVPDWDIPSKSVIYYTDSQLLEPIAEACRNSIQASNLPIVSASLKPLGFGKNIVINRERGTETYFRQIVAALEASSADIIFFTEHDVIYHPSHFDFTPPSKDKFYYNHNWWKVRFEDDLAVHWDADQVSGLCCYRELALAHYRKIVDNFNEATFDRKYEPGSGIASEAWKSAEPLVDIRYGRTMTKSKWSLDDFRDKSTAKNFQTGQQPEWAKQIINEIRCQI